MIRRRRPNPLLAAMVAATGFVVIAGLNAASSAPARASSQEPQAAAVQQGINYRERPRFPFDPQRLKRRPVLDGTIGDNEWDALYTIGEGPVTGTVYLNWDEENLYFAARTDQAAWVVLDIDANDDGWLRGNDNLELVLAPMAEGVAPPLLARVLDASSGKDTPVWNERAIDLKSVRISSKVSGNQHVVEMAIPKGLAGISPRLNGQIGVRADFLPATATPSPTQPYEPHLLLDVRFVESHVVAAPGIAPKLILDDAKVIPGQPLKATLEILSQTEDETRVRAITWKGEGPAQDILRMERVPSPGAATLKKPLRHHYTSAIPDTTVPGFYQISATADLEGGRQVSSTASFSVVEPFTVQVVPEHDSVPIGTQTKVRVNVEIMTAAPGYTRADVELETPAGLVVEGRKRKSFDIGREDTGTKVPFFLTVPAGATPGEYIVHATVYWRGKTWKAHQTLHLTGAGASAPAGGK